MDRPAGGQAVTCDRLSKTYGAGDNAVPALSPTDIRFVAGQTTALIGPSGCGKSTLLRLVAGLETPTTGHVLIGDETPKDQAKRGAIAMAFQDASLLPWRTVRTNITLALTLSRRKQSKTRVAELIDLVGLNGFENRRPAELSGGMRQRAAIARCLVSNPELLLLDEPFGAVDELTRLRLNEELPRLWRMQGTTALLVTHSVREAVLLSDRIVVLSARPATVVDDIKVVFDNARNHELIKTHAFQSVVDQVTAALLNGGNREAIAAQ